MVIDLLHEEAAASGFVICLHLLTITNWEVLLTVLRDKRPCSRIYIDWSIGHSSMS